MAARHREVFLGLLATVVLALPLFSAGFSVAFSAEAQEKAADNKAADEKVAVVNGSAITRADFDSEVRHLQRRLTQMGRPVDETKDAELRKQVLEHLIDRELLYQESAKKSVQVSDAEVNEQIQKLESQFGGKAQFETMLGKMGLTETAIRSQYKRGMAIEKLIEKEILPKVKISDDAVKAYYDGNQKLFAQPEQVRARHVLVKVAPDADASKKAEARQKIEKALGRLKKGEGFEQVAKEVSECPSSAKGGDLGYFRRGQMVKPFEEVAFGLKPGVLSGIVETDFGYHIIKVEDTKPASVASYDEVKEEVRERLKQEKVEGEVAAYLEKLKTGAKVERHLATDG